MLSKLELTVIEDHKVHGFGARLTGIEGIYASVKNAVDGNRDIEIQQLRDFYGKLTRDQTGFDDVYLNRLNSAPANPLEYEQQAWKLLSPLIAEYLRRFRQYIDESEHFDGTEVIRRLDEGRELVNKWSIIGGLYKVKMEIVASEKLPASLEAKGIPIEEALPNYEHTHPIWLKEQYAEISRREETVKQLIQELSRSPKPIPPFSP